MRRLARRDQLLAAATRAFARNGFAATNLDDVAQEAGISKVLLYRHFDSKMDLYRAVLERSAEHLASRVGRDQFTRHSIRALLEAAAEDPDGFRLLFHHAAREPDFRSEMDRFRATSVETARRQLAQETSRADTAELSVTATELAMILGGVELQNAKRRTRYQRREPALT